uniref:Reverse transcriptase domain-containing protein n=1 Tax=Tanacetum cinerariifolium TaxID=118510 RepID=A0A6L2JRR8_TANCI|nr:hypothetical protein [Tanacetum cinerariifolium]
MRLVVVHILIISVKPPVATLKTYMLPQETTMRVEVERDLKTITDQALPESTTRVPPSVDQPSIISRSFELPPYAASTSSELPKRNPHQPPIPYPSWLNKEKLQDKSDIQVHKFLQMFKKLYFNISLVDALALMPNGPPKKLPEKLGDLGKFLIPCDFLKLEKCMALANLGTSINLMPLSVWKKLMHPELIPTRMTLELANRSIAYPTDIDEDVCVQVGKFTFPADVVVVDYDVDHRVPLILGRHFLTTARALVDVYREELILRDGDEKLIFHADSTSKDPHKHGNKSINIIRFIDITCEDHFQEEFAYELILLDPFPLRNEDDNFNPEADLREIKYLLNRDPSTDSSPTSDIDIIDLILERFTDEPVLIYSSPPGDDDDDLLT